MHQLGGVLLSGGVDRSGSAAGLTHQSTLTHRDDKVLHKIHTGELSRAGWHTGASARMPEGRISPERQPGLYPMNVRSNSPTRQRAAVVYPTHAPPAPVPAPVPVPVAVPVPTPVPFISPVVVPAENQLASLAGENDAKNDHLTGRLEMVEAQMEVLNSSNRSDGALEALRARLQQAESALHSQELGGLMKALAQKQARIEELEAMLLEASKQKGQQQGNERDAQVLAELRAKLAEERRAHDELRARHKEMLASALDDINAANEKLSQQDLLIEELRRGKGDLGPLRDRIADLERENEALRGRIPKHNISPEDLYELQEELKRAKKRIFEFESAVDDTPRWQAKINQLTETIRSLEEDLARMRQGMKEKDDEIRKLHADMRSQEDLKLELERLRERMSAEIERAARAAELRAEEKVSSLEAELRKLRGELERTQHQLAESQEALKKGREEDARRIRTLEEELRKSERRAADLEDEAQKLRRLADRARDLEDQASEAQSKLRETEKALRNAHHRLEDADHELKKERDAASRLKMENDRLAERITELEAHRRELEATRRELEATIRELDALKRDAARLKEQLKEAQQAALDAQQAAATAQQALNAARAAAAQQPPPPPPQPVQQPQPQPQQAPRSPGGATLINAPTTNLHGHPVHPVVVMPTDEDELMRMGVELRRALRGREEALAELESAQRQLTRAKRQNEVTQQELATAEGKLVALKRHAEELKDDLESTVAQLNRARATAQDAIEEAEATARLLNEARKIAEESRDRMHLETLRYQKELEMQEQQSREALMAQEHARKLLEMKCHEQEERARTLSEGIAALQYERTEATHNMEQLRGLLQAERDAAEHHLKETVDQVNEAHRQQLAELEGACAVAQGQAKEISEDARSQKELFEREITNMQRALSSEKARHGEAERTLDGRAGAAADKLAQQGAESQQLKELLADTQTQKTAVERDLKATQLALAKYQDYVQDKEKDCDELRAKVEQEQGNGQAAVARMDQELAKLKADLDAQKLAERGQAEALAEVHQCYEEASQEAKQLRLLLDATSAETEETKAALKDLQSQASEWYKALQDSTKKCTDLAAAHQVLEEEGHNLKRQCGLAEAACVEKDRGIEGLTRQIMDLRQDLDQKSAGLDEASLQRSNLASEVQCLTAEGASLKHRLTELSLESEQLRSAGTTDRTLGLQLQHQAERAQAELAASQARLEESLAQESALRKDSRALQEAADRLRLALHAEEQKSAADAVQTHQLVQEYDSRIGSLESMVQKLRGEKECLRGETDRLTVMHDTALRTEKRLSLEAESHQAIIRDQELQAQNLAATVQKQRQDVEALRSELTLASEREDAATRRVGDTQRLNEARERSLAEEAEMERHTRQDIEAQLTKARSQLRQAKKDLAVAQEHAEEEQGSVVEEANLAVKRLRVELDTMRRAHESATAALSLLQTTLFQHVFQQEAELRELHLALESAEAALLWEALASGDMRLKLGRVSTELDLQVCRGAELSSAAEEAKYTNQKLQTEASAMHARLEATAQQLSLARGESQNDVKKLCSEIDQLTMEAADLRRALEATTAERDHLAVECSHTTAESDRLAIDLQSHRDASDAQLSLQRAESQAAADMLNEEVRGLAQSFEDVQQRSEHLWNLIEAVVGPRPCEGIGQVVWRIRSEGEASPHAHLLVSCEALTRIVTVGQMAGTLKADFDFICATRDTLALELGTCRKSASDSYRESTRLMEDILKEANSGAGVRYEREGLSRLCASLGGLRSQLQWIVTNCLSAEEREAAGIQEGDDVGNTIEELRRTALPGNVSPKSAAVLGVATTPTARARPSVLVSPTLSRGAPSDFGDYASCIGSDEARSERAASRSAPRTTPQSNKKGVRFVSPPEGALTSPPNNRHL